jgi:hypothetical protein
MTKTSCMNTSILPLQRSEPRLQLYGQARTSRVYYHPFCRSMFCSSRFKGWVGSWLYTQQDFASRPRSRNNQPQCKVRISNTFAFFWLCSLRSRECTQKLATIGNLFMIRTNRQRRSIVKSATALRRLELYKF